MGHPVGPPVEWLEELYLVSFVPVGLRSVVVVGLALQCLPAPAHLGRPAHQNRRVPRRLLRRLQAHRLEVCATASEAGYVPFFFNGK